MFNTDVKQMNAEDKLIIDSESYTNKTKEEETINMAPNIGYHNSNVSNYYSAPRKHISC